MIKYRGSIKDTICLMIFLSLPTAALCDGLSGGTTGEDGSKISAPVTMKKAGNKRNNGKKLDMGDTEKLKEIAEKSIMAVENPQGDGGDSMGLPVKGRISSTVGLRPDPINGNIRMHNGIDIAIPEGTPVKPVASGRVAYSGMQPGYGNMAIVQHEDGMISIYAHHLRNVVKTGDRVTKETILAYSGSTGHSTGPHLHFEAWQAGRNVTSAFLPTFSGRKIEASSHLSLEKTNLRKAIMSDGTILFIEAVGGNKKKKPVAGS